MIIYKTTKKQRLDSKIWRDKNPEKVKESNQKWGSRQIRFKGKRIHLQFNPRTGVCSECGSDKLTHLHHKQYDESDPLAYTIELCQSCHAKTHDFGQAGRLLGLAKRVKIK